MLAKMKLYEDLSEDEEGFWDVLFGWLMFWK